MTSAHAYGPHRKADQPTSVTVFRAEGDFEVPVPFEIRRQRWQLNTLAHERAARFAARPLELQLADRKICGEADSCR